MTQLILYIASSLDGYIARKNGEIDWLPPIEENVNDYGYKAFFSSIDALVMGSKTYEQILTFGGWPYHDKLCHVFTQRSLNAARRSVYFVKETVAQFMADITRRQVKRLWLVGGGELIADFMREGLIDDYIITVIPTILGEGIPLFKPSLSETRLQFLASKNYPDGVCELHYKKLI